MYMLLHVQHMDMYVLHIQHMNIYILYIFNILHNLKTQNLNMNILQIQHMNISTLHIQNMNIFIRRVEHIQNMKTYFDLACVSQNTMQLIGVKEHLTTATHCNTLHNTATHCTTLQHTATHCATLKIQCN